MRLLKIVLAGTAALALSLTLGACSLSVNGSGSGDSGTPAAQSEQKDSQSTDSKDTSKADAKGAATADSQSASGGSAQAAAAPITDPTWKDIISKGEREEVLRNLSVVGDGLTYNLVGSIGDLNVGGSDVKVAAEDVDTVTIRGSNVTVYARDIKHLRIMGSNATVHWLGDDPDIQDTGANNTTGKLTQ